MLITAEFISILCWRSVGEDPMDEFLDNMVGEWNLRGKMGDVTLFQKAVGR
jgi:hypothetical protein